MTKMFAHRFHCLPGPCTEDPGQTRIPWSNIPEALQGLSGLSAQIRTLEGREGPDYTFGTRLVGGCSKDAWGVANMCVFRSQCM